MPRGIADNLIGKKFGRWFVVSKTGIRKGKSLWKCVCSCGNVVDVFGVSLTHGTSKSCGCNRDYQHKKHGKYKTDEYRIWRGIINRCDNKNGPAYQNYGGRGIKVCERWKSNFENFLSDMGNRPSKKHSIDRIDVEGNYDPNNCRWATYTEQARNTRLRKGNTTGCPGVTIRSSGRYHVIIYVNRKRMYVGMFDTIQEAIKARKEAEIKYWNKESP